MATLPNGHTTNSREKKKGVKIKAVKGVNYPENAFVTVKNTTNDRFQNVNMTDQTDITVDLGSGVYSITNNAGGTIEYEWQ